MIAKSHRLSGIARILQLLNQPQHPYRPATTIFLDLDVSRIADELQLVKRGRERGSKNLPPKDALTLDDVEHQIIERIEAHKQQSHTIFLDHLDTYNQRLAALNFEERFSVIRQAAPQAVGDFNAEATLGRDELFALRRRIIDSEAERDHFRKKHKIIRPARILSTGKALLKIGVLAVLFVIEVAVNASFLADANLGGWLGGAVQAVAFAALNILASFLWGLFPIRLINRRNVGLKFLGLLSLILYFGFALLLNIALAHLREVPPSLSANGGQFVLDQLTSKPYELYKLRDVMSWVLFGVGFIFSLVAMADGLLFFDPYIGYAGLERRWIEASQSYTDTKAELIESLREIRDDASEAMNAAARDLSIRRSEYDSILQARRGFGQRFGEHQNQIERACRALLQIYREANAGSRSANNPPPAYFAQLYSMERVVFSAPDDVSTREQLLRTIVKTQELLEDQVRAIYVAFDQAVLSYSEIDRMIPEKGLG
jgi:hypothetical protein